MRGQNCKSLLVVGLVFLICGWLFVVPQVVDARGTIYTGTWVNLYPTSQTDDNVINGTGKNCQICHESSSGGNGWNGYGWQIWLGLDAGKTTQDAILDAEPFNSDLGSDGSLNSAEINVDTQPGWTTGNNTIYFKDGSTAPGSPPAGIGALDPAPTAVPEPGLFPTAYALSQSWPNPCRSSTTMAFNLPAADQVLLRVFDINGRLIKTLVNERLGPGSYRVTWYGDLDAGQKAAPGIYFYRIDTPRYRQTRKAILL